MEESRSLRTDNRHTRLKWFRVYLEQERKEYTKFSLMQYIDPHWLVDPFLSQRRCSCTHFPLHTAVERCTSVPMRSEIQKAVGVPEGQGQWCTHLSRTKQYTLSLKQENIFSHKVRKPAQAMWAFYLSVRSVPGPRPIFMCLSGSQKIACMRLPFPTNSKILLDLSYLLMSKASTKRKKIQEKKAPSLWALLFISL